MHKERGLVISAPVKGSVQNRWVEFSGGGPNPQELRFSLLFWDKLEYPLSQFSELHGPDVHFLQSAGILRRTEWAGANDRFEWRPEDLIVRSQVGVFRALNEAEPDVWSLASGEGSFNFQPSELVLDRGVLVKLHRAIPVPDKTVSFQDIIKFREKRRPELLTLRYHLEDVYQRIISAGDGPLALSTEIGKLDLAIADHLRVSKEFGFTLRLTSLDAGLNLIPGVTAGLTALNAGLPISSALMVGGAAALSFGPNVGLSWRKPGPTPFRYVSAYHKELF